MCAFISSSQNPAEIVSCGASSNEIRFLYDHTVQFPSSKFLEQSPLYSELKYQTSLTTISNKHPAIQRNILKHCADYTESLRITAIC